MAKVHRFCATSRAEPRVELTLAARHPSTSLRLGRLAMNNLKLRVLPYAGALTVLASLAGYFGGR
jgi:hypothetical protein